SPDRSRGWATGHRRPGSGTFGWEFDDRAGSPGAVVPGLIGPHQVRAVAEAALRLPGPDGVEVLFLHEWGGLTRFADSAIHQSTWREDIGLRVRVVSEGRVGVAGSND